MGGNTLLRSVETSDAQDNEAIDAPATRTTAKVLSQSAHGNDRADPSDETDLRQFDEIIDVGDTPLDDLQPLGDAIPPVDLPRHAFLASSLDECEITINRASASEACMDRGPK